MSTETGNQGHAMRPPRLWKKGDLAHFLGCSESTVARLAKRGRAIRRIEIDGGHPRYELLDESLIAADR